MVDSELCELCSALQTYHFTSNDQPVLRELTIHDLKRYSDTCPGLCGCIYLGLTSVVSPAALQQTKCMSLGGGRKSNSNFRIHGTDAEWEGDTFKAEFFADSDYLEWPGVMFLSSPVLPLRSDSTQSLDQISHWLQNCRDNHQECCITNRQTTTRIRILELHDTEVQLVEGFDVNERYAALSHCWGDAKHITTTKASQISHRKGIALVNLPQTFRDAAKVCRLLQIKCLWIDSLCIIQDDPVDWAVEASKMQDVYKYADIVLAASAAKNSSQGLFLERSPVVKLRCPSMTGTNVSATLFARKAIEHTQYTLSGSEGEEREPLTTRAWCLQEWLLARRMVHFSASELVWDCLQEGRCECKTLDMQFQSLFDGDGKGRVLRDQLKRILRNTEDQNSDALSIVRLWTSIVEEYTARGLSRTSDRLVAILGLAKELNGIPAASPYQAGFMHLEFERQLLWSRKDSTRPMARSSDSVAPSWSWGSITDSVEWAVLWQGSSDSFPSIDNADIEDFAQIEVVSDDQNKSPAIEKYKLRISTTFLQGTIRADPILEYGQCTALVYHGTSNEELEIFITMDVDLGSRLSVDMRIVFVKIVSFKWSEDSGEETICGTLVLSPSITRPKCFERIGVVLGDIPVAWYSSGQVSEFCII